MRSRASFFTFIFVAGSLVLPVAAHAAIPFFGPIVPSPYNLCPGGWNMLIMVTNNIIAAAITLAIVFVAPLTIAYAGFILVTGQGNSGSISRRLSV